MLNQPPAGSLKFHVKLPLYGIIIHTPQHILYMPKGKVSRLIMPPLICHQSRHLFTIAKALLLLAL